MRVRIVVLVGATSSLVLVAFLVPLAILVRSSTADHALGAAVVEAQTLAPLVATGSGDRLARAVAEANEQSAHPVTVFLPDGQVVGATAPETDAVALGRTGQSLTDQVPGGREVIVAVEGLPAGTAVIPQFRPLRRAHRRGHPGVDCARPAGAGPVGGQPRGGRRVGPPADQTADRCG